VYRGGGDWKMELKGRIISKGKGAGEALVTSQPISFYGGVDPNTGEIIEKGHELQGKSVKGKVLVFPTGERVNRWLLYAVSDEEERRGACGHNQQGMRDCCGGWRDNL
jgi:predicted aconitase with swiveling domain